MAIKQVLENQADDNVNGCYIKIKSLYKTKSLPVFFTYLGAFPEYLNFILEQMSLNMNDDKFNILVADINRQINPLIKEALPKNRLLCQFIDKYKNTPSFYHFQKESVNIFEINIKLTLFFIGFREAIKGWIVAAKKITDSSSSGASNYTATHQINNQEFIYDYDADFNINDTGNKNIDNNMMLAKINNSLTVQGTTAIDIDFAGYYYRLAKLNFDELQKTETFWRARIGCEELTLYYIDLMPFPLHSSVATFYELTKKYPDFIELLYLMSESFPILSIHRLLFSGFLMTD